MSLSPPHTNIAAGPITSERKIYTICTYMHIWIYANQKHLDLSVRKINNLFSIRIFKVVCVCFISKNFEKS